jgi:hypothetical protein
MAVSMSKASGKHRQCNVWQHDGAACVGHGPWCDRVVAVDVTPLGEVRTLMFVGEGTLGGPVVQLTGTARHAA